MRGKPSSIRVMLLLSVGMLTSLMIALVLWESSFQWKKLVSIKGMAGISQRNDLLFDAVEKLASERDNTVTLLQNIPIQGEAELQTQLHRDRAEADKLLVATFTTLKYAGALHQDNLELVKKQQELLQALRPEIDRQIKLTQQDRDPAVTIQSFDSTTALILSIQALWMNSIQQHSDLDPRVTLHMRFKHTLSRLMEYSGRERALVSRLIARKQPPLPEEQALLLRWHGAVEFGLEQLQSLAIQGHIHEVVLPYIKDVESQYATVHDMVRESFYLPNVNYEGQYPLSPELWLEIAEGTTNSFYALKDAAQTDTRQYREMLEEQMRKDIVMHMLILIGGLFLCIYSFYIIIRRVITPIDRMVRALENSLHGGPEVSISEKDAQRSDEIGKLARVLHAVQHTMNKIRYTTKELERSENKLRAVVNHTLDGLITIDGKGRIESFNPACEKIFGYHAQEVIGENVSKLMPEPYHSEHDGYLENYHTTGKAKIIGTAGREVRAQRKDGSTFPIDLSISMFMLEGEKHFSGIIRDITERKEAQARLLRYTHDLERSNKELDDFAYIASHDLKEPLRGLHNHAHFLLEDNADKLDEESTGRLNRLVYLSQRMEKLVNDLLYFSRLGRQELAIQPTDLNETVHDIESMLENFLQERSGHILIPQPLPVLTCDKIRVTEALRNLITNALKYNDSEEKVVEIGFLERQESSEGEVLRDVVYVKDNGRGIPKEFYEEIFRIFKRLQAAKGTQEEGTGVGLTFVKKIIERHGGRIWITSTPGVGSTFYFTLKGA